MAVSFVGAGALAGNATTPSQAALSHASTAIDDIYIACWISKTGNADPILAPDGTWTQIVQGTNGGTVGTHQYAIFWKRATAAGAQSFTFTKAIDNNTLLAGVISSWSGCPLSGSPLDATAAGVTAETASTDAVPFPAFDPTRTDTHVLFCAFYGNDLTTFAAAMSSDTDPDCTTRDDQETNTGTDASLAITSGDSSGANIAVRTWASSSTTDACNTGVVFALVPRITTDKTQSGVARVTGQTTRTQSGIARITVQSTQAQTGVARVTAQSTQTQSGIARITRTTDQTQIGTARIMAQTTKAQSGIARIQQRVDQTITGVANITAAGGVTTSQTITGKANITAGPVTTTSYNYGWAGSGNVAGGQMTPEQSARVAAGDHRYIPR